MSFQWYVLRTEPRAEYQAAKALGRDGYEVLFPRLRVDQNRAGHEDTPLFPGYLFIRCDAHGEGWPSFRMGHRITGWVSFGGEVPSLPDESVAELMQRLELINRDGGMRRPFQTGQEVRIVSNEMDILATVVEDAKSVQAPVKVLLELMGRLVPAQVPWKILFPVEDDLSNKYRLPRRTRGRGRWIRGFGPTTVANA